MVTGKSRIDAEKTSFDDITNKSTLRQVGLYGWDGSEYQKVKVNSSGELVVALP